MARPTDVSDPGLRSLLIDAEHDLDGGNYDDCVHKSVDAYTQLLGRHPELYMPQAPPSPMALPNPGEVRVPVRGQHRPWPVLCGVTVELDGERKPVARFEKDYYTMTEAMTYLEYTLDMAMTAQRAQIG